MLEGPIQHPAWHAAYESLALPRLDSQIDSAFWVAAAAWVAAMSCSSGPLVGTVGTVGTVGSMQELHDTVCCSASCCVAQLETLSHTFMGCPVVRPAVAWLGGLCWSKVVAGV